MSNTQQANPIVDSLYTAIAKFRRERDEARRGRDLSAERQKIAEADRLAEEGKASALRAELDDIQRQIRAATSHELAPDRHHEAEVAVWSCHQTCKLSLGTGLVTKPGGTI